MQILGQCQWTTKAASSQLMLKVVRIPSSINYIAIAEGNRPSVRMSNPTDSQTNVSPDMSITADVNLPNSGIAVNTLSASTIKLIDNSTNTQVDANYNTSGGGDVIVVSPINHLKKNIKYLLKITDGVKDINAAAFLPYSISFTTAHQQQEAPLVNGKRFV